MAVASIMNIILILLASILCAFIIISTVLFIKDGIAAKREGRPRTKSYTVMFIISMALLGLVITVTVLLILLTFAIMTSM
ncbi:MAG: hypothetical protein K5669_09905 [Lachnospiraceae bacterium]|nr:hypothetical protein [Lachnospiraceae bacterium]